jgi:hypothetical protein
LYKSHTQESISRCDSVIKVPASSDKVQTTYTPNKEYIRKLIAYAGARAQQEYMSLQELSVQHLIDHPAGTVLQKSTECDIQPERPLLNGEFSLPDIYLTNSMLYKHIGASFKTAMRPITSGHVEGTPGCRG